MPRPAIEGVSARVHPALVPPQHPLAAVHGANNAVFLEAEAAGSLMFYGAGAGGVQTASAVLGDLVSAARRHVIGGPGVGRVDAREPADPADRRASRPATRSPSWWPTSRACSRGSRTLFAEHGVSVETRAADACGRRGRRATATLVIGTHEATEAALAATVAALEGSDVVSRRRACCGSKACAERRILTNGSRRGAAFSASTPIDSTSLTRRRS